MRLFGRLAAVVVAAAFMLLPQNAAAQNIDLNLSLLVDVSGSVDQAEFQLQRDGYVAAFQNSDVHAAIASLASDGGGVAVNVVYWDDGAYTAVNWTLLTDATSSNNFASLIAATSDATSGATAPGTAINYAVNNWSPWTADRNVIDVSGDGRQNTGLTTSFARDRALAGFDYYGTPLGFTVDAINGLAILTDDSGLGTWYASNVQGGTGSFTLAVNDFPDFEQAVIDKIDAEISGETPPGAVPEPAAMLLMASGLLGVGFVARRRRNGSGDA